MILQVTLVRSLARTSSTGDTELWPHISLQEPSSGLGFDLPSLDAVSSANAPPTLPKLSTDTGNLITRNRYSMGGGQKHGVAGSISH